MAYGHQPKSEENLFDKANRYLQTRNGKELRATIRNIVLHRAEALKTFTEEYETGSTDLVQKARNGERAAVELVKAIKEELENHTTLFGGWNHGFLGQTIECPEMFIQIAEGCADAGNLTHLNTNCSWIKRLPSTTVFAVECMPLQTLLQLEQIVCRTEKTEPKHLYEEDHLRLVFHTGNADKCRHVIDRLLEYNPDPFTFASAIHTVMHRNIMFYCSRGNIDMIKFILELSQRDVFLPPVKHGSFAMHKENMLYQAIKNGQEAFVDFMLEIGANPQKNQSGAVRVAAESGHLNLVKKLYPLSGKHRDYTPILAAIKNGHQEVVDWLTPFINYDALRNNISASHTESKRVAASLIAKHESETLLKKHSIGTRKSNNTGL